MKNFYLEGPGGLPGIEQVPAGSQVQTKKVFNFQNGIAQGGVLPGTPAVLTPAATIAFTPTTQVTQLTPGQNETINFSAPPAAGVEIFLEVITSGVSSYTLTFGTNTKTTGTLATGTTTAKTFIIAFVSDGTNWVETSRTTAM
ncbi:MAG: hypothetical protein KGL39_39690 [Patescibacteria group bacterium]|nr:hypothetical protein [Patescibacteria group bacterium]